MSVTRGQPSVRVIRGPSDEGPLLTWGHRIEAICGAVVGLLVPLGVCGASLVLPVIAWTGGAPRWASYLALAIVPAALSVRFISNRLERMLRVPLPRLAMEQPRYPLAVRPLVSLWWVGNFGLSLLLVHFLLDHYRDAIERGFFANELYWVMVVAVTFAGGVASNFFLLLAVAAIGAPASWVGRIWFWRFAIDVVVALASPVLLGHLPGAAEVWPEF